MPKLSKDIVGNRIAELLAEDESSGCLAIFPDRDACPKMLFTDDVRFVEQRINAGEPHDLGFRSRDHCPEQSRLSFARVDHLLDETGATLWIEHSKALADSQKKAPEFYD